MADSDGRRLSEIQRVARGGTLNVELDRLWEMVDKGGTIALAFLIIVAFLRGWIVPRWAYTELKDRCTQLSILADRATELADRQTLAREAIRRKQHKEGP